MTSNRIGKDGKKCRVMEHLMPLNIGKLYKQIDNDERFGFLPVMARSSRCNIGSLMTESFCERVISAWNIVMTDVNTLLNGEELDMMMTLRMNREFIKWARKMFPHLKYESFCSDVIPEAENVEEY